jgi:hypothetical protein
MRLIGLAVVLALGLTLPPLVAEAQPAGKVYRIGILANSPEAWAPLRTRLAELGYTEGTIQYELRSADGQARSLSCSRGRPRPS